VEVLVVRISHRKKFVFLSNPRCGSNSIRRILDGHSDVFSAKSKPFFHHTDARSAKVIFFDRGWDWSEYHSFTTIRNPWARTLSRFLFAKIYSQSAWGKLCAPFLGFDEFIHDDEVQRRLKRQSRIPYEGATAKPGVDNIFCIEKPDPIIQFLNGLGIRKLDRLPHINSTLDVNYRNWFDRRSRGIVEDIFWRDIEVGVYCF